MPRSFSGNSACMTFCPLHVYSKTSFFSLAIRIRTFVIFQEDGDFWSFSQKSTKHQWFIFCSTLEAIPQRNPGRFGIYSTSLEATTSTRGPEPRAREMAEFSRRYLRCHDYVSSDPDIFKHLLDHNSTSRRNGFCIVVSLKATKKRKSMGMSWFSFQPKEQLIKMKAGCHFDIFRWEDIHIFKPDRCTKSVWVSSLPSRGGRVSTLANRYPNIKTNIRPWRLHLQGYMFDVWIYVLSHFFSIFASPLLFHPN